MYNHSNSRSVFFDSLLSFLNKKKIIYLGTTRNATLVLPMEFPVGAGELTIVGTGGVSFVETRDVIIYDSRYVVLVQTSASTYSPGDTMQIRVVATNEELIPLENSQVLIEVYVCFYFFSFATIHYILSNFRMLILKSLVNFQMFH
jgi:hypothetical protein